MQLRHFLYFPSIVLVSAAAQIRIVFPFEIQSCFTHVAGEYAVIAFQPACQQEQGVVKCIIVTAVKIGSSHAETEKRVAGKNHTFSFDNIAYAALGMPRGVCRTLNSMPAAVKHSPPWRMMSTLQGFTSAPPR